MTRPTRRAVIQAGIAATAVAGLDAFPARALAATSISPAGTTLAATVLRGAAGSGGYRKLVAGPGEPHIVRTDLGGAVKATRTLTRRAVMVFAQFTDVHLVDAQSPARVEFLDRYNDGPSSGAPFDAAYRAQEMLTTQLHASIIKAVNRVARGPVTGKAFEFTVCTGDLVDNTQLNELRWFIDLMDGRTIRPDSGDHSKYEGVMDQDSTTYDAHYWHPDGTPSGKVADNALALYGFPVVKGLLDAARRPFQGERLNTPWYVAFGNHDPLRQGNAPENAALDAIATGPLKVVDLPAGLSPADVQTGLSNADPTILAALATAPARTVTADPNRRSVTRSEWMAEFFKTSSSPVGHGFGMDNVNAGKGYYAYDHGPHVRCIVLDTVNPGGYADGSLDAAQFSWLQAELAAYNTVKIVGGAKQANGGVNKLIVLFSHHNLATMGNPVLAPGETQPRVMGPAVQTELLQWPNVVLWVNGHTHVNQVFAHPRSGGGGFWEVNTAAHIDWPHQARIFEMVDNRDGTLSFFATMVDADAPLAFGGNTGSYERLASLGRELGANDWQFRPAAGGSVNEGGRRGQKSDRNVELVLAAPFDVLGRVVTPARPGGGRTGPTVKGTRNGKDLANTGLSGGLGVAAGAAVAAAGLAAAARRRLSRDEGDIG